MSHDLPPALAAAVAQALAGQGGLRAGSAALSAHYRQGGASGPGIDLAAYLAARLPATFAAVDRVLEELADAWPEFAPASLLDAGAGPGTASWAAASRWPELAAATLVDTNGQFLTLARSLAADGPAALAGARFRLVSLLAPPDGQADLVIAAYALAELPEAEAARAATTLWQGASQALVLVEPGTPQGFARIARARAALLATGAQLLAPCPGAGPCPMAEGDWCHFAVRLARRRLHMQVKAATVPFEDEKFSYLIASRGGGTPAATRILAPPQAGKAGVTAKLCTPQGLSRVTIARRAADAYKRARKWHWGGTATDPQHEP
jgi:ribosomal protein RSM22 (predicted rRNA methylase)